MSKSNKKLISQRWDQSFSGKVREVASKLNMTLTDLTIESLEFMISLYGSKPEIIQDQKARSQYLEEIIRYGVAKPKHNQSTTKNKSSDKRESGFIIDRLVNYLKTNIGQTFSSTELAELLDIPQPTVRTYIRNLSESNSDFKLIQGRPNFIGYFEK